MSKLKKHQNKEFNKTKTFPIPFSSEEIKEDISFNTKTTKKTSREIINEAIRLHSQGNIKEASKNYKSLVEEGISDPIVFSNYGMILRDLGKLKEAEILTRKAIRIKPNYAPAHNNLGRILTDLRKFNEAEASIRKAIKFKPDFAIAYYNLGKVLSDLNNLEGAVLNFKNAINLKFGFTEAYDALSSVLEKLGRHKEAQESFQKILSLNSVNSSSYISKKNSKNNNFITPKNLDYQDFYRPGMGTENVGGFLRSMAMMLRPKRVLEIGAGYTTPFLLEALINNERVFDDGNLSETYFKNYTYDSKLVVIDNQSLGELTKRKGMEEIINSKYTDFFEGNFEGMAKALFEKHGNFDFVWFDCGGPKEYASFINEFWQYCSNYIFFHFTYRDGKPNQNHKIIHEKIKGNPIMIDIVEPHKKRQGSITIVKK